MKYITSLKYKDACDIIWMCLYDTGKKSYISVFLDGGKIVSKKDDIDKDNSIKKLLDTNLWEYYNPFPEVSFTRTEDGGETSTLSPDMVKDIIEIDIDKKFV